MDDIKVLVCDDSALMRNLISKIIDSTEGLKTVGTAMNGKFCLRKIPELQPDLILLDIEMPEMTGVQFLEERKKQNIDVPVVILSSIAEKGAPVTIKCLELGASDFITKPSGSISSNIAVVSGAIIEKVFAYGGKYAKIKETEIDAAKKGLLEKVKSLRASSQPFTPSLWQSKKKEIPEIKPVRPHGRIDVIAIGISTGGPNALREVFASLDPKLNKPILVVQHMPEGFTKEFAASLDRVCPLSVKEAEDGDYIHPGQVYIAPGNYHIVVEHSTLCNIVRLSKDDLRNGHRPSADVLFESVAKIYKNRALGIIMTGMGRDGAEQITEMRKEGAWTLGQDEDSSIVYGMPRVAWELGGVERQVSLKNMADEINRLVKENS